VYEIPIKSAQESIQLLQSLVNTCDVNDLETMCEPVLLRARFVAFAAYLHGRALIELAHIGWAAIDRYDLESPFTAPTRDAECHTRKQFLGKP
jgi:hypothetical protein